MIHQLNPDLKEVTIGEERFYKIGNTQDMRPFFMSIVSDSNHWLFVSSNGGISAGRKNCDFALFPYYTDDKIEDNSENTGSKTIIQWVNADGSIQCWEPFSVRSENLFSCQRNIYQSAYGNKVIFEEINETIGLSFRCEWNSSDQFGFVKKATIINLSNNDFVCKVLDGLQNILPYGVGADLQNSTSNLADAYKRSELLPKTGLGMYALSAIIVDKAEPSEALKANIVWSLGLPNPTFLLSALQLNNFRKGKQIVQEEDIKGERGAYFMVSEVSIGAEQSLPWITVADVNQQQAAIVWLNEMLEQKSLGKQQVLNDVALGTANLVKLVAEADGLQSTADRLKDARHFSNVLFNIMRGGIFDNHYQIEKWDFTHYLQKANKPLSVSLAPTLDKLENVFSLATLKALLKQTDNADFRRLATEYLPLKFSRRHGDPSRPWNKFSINTKSETDGSKILDYEGNWRDIFQNWEALAHAYPAFIEGMIYKFLNASTFEGYNPYRVTKDGFDWETIEPDNPWSYIGYWGDHQIIYLLKFLEFAEQYQAGSIEKLLQANDFVYANVPYRIKSYTDIVKNPKDTIEYDHANEKKINERIKQWGADGKLLTTSHGNICRATFAEKILATLLSKLSNLVPEGGIWMNTQRPEWNDANNALVGNGLSMVTLCYVRRFFKFLQPIIETTTQSEIRVASELHYFFEAINNILHQHTNHLHAPFTPTIRKEMTDALGNAGSQYRNTIYDQQFSGNTKAIRVEKLAAFIDTSLAFLEHSIRANKRADNLYHAYNLLSYHNHGIEVSYLSEMLEGQVAVLSSGFLNAQQSLEVLDALRSSALYRPDQNSYMLYPNKQLPGFLVKNVIPAAPVEKSALLQKLLTDGNTAILNRDIKGQYHFNGNFRNVNDLDTALNHLLYSYQSMAIAEKDAVKLLFEEVFNHKEFTGRSGTFYGYEGLGSIYWHMVSKLALAVQETCCRTHEEHENKELLGKLIYHYNQITDGIGVHKTPALYGSFPITPYSHTPFGKGAKQPGMTGQVKEDILCRIGELGIKMKDGQLVFDPYLLHVDEFKKEPSKQHFVAISGANHELTLPANSLAFTVCQVPVICRLGSEGCLEVHFADNKKETYNSFALPKAISHAIFDRTGAVSCIEVVFTKTQLNHA